MELAGLDSLNWYTLPPLVQDIARRCGRQVAADLLREFDGRRIRVPVPPVDGSTILAQRIGLDAATKLARSYPGQYLPIPRCHAALLRIRNDAIRAERQGGATPAMLAERWRLTERQIFKIIAGVKPADEKQAELF